MGGLCAKAFIVVVRLGRQVEIYGSRFRGHRGLKKTSALRDRIRNGIEVVVAQLIMASDMPGMVHVFTFLELSIGDLKKMMEEI